MKIISRIDEIKQIFSNHFPKEIIDNILKQEKEIINKSSKSYHLSISPIYSGYTDNYFFTLKKHRHILYDQDLHLMNHIRYINGSTQLVRKERDERIWGKYLPSFRY
jgi:hypothetical protein